MGTAERVLQGFTRKGQAAAAAVGDGYVKSLAAAATATTYKTSYSSAYGSAAVAAAQRSRPFSATPHAPGCATAAVQGNRFGGNSSSSSGGGSRDTRVSLTADAMRPAGRNVGIGAGPSQQQHGHQQAGQQGVGPASLPYALADVRFAAYGGVRNMASNMF
jgi:hypothetical protein